MDNSCRETRPVAHIVHSIGPHSFGLGAVAASLAAHQTAGGCPAQVWTLDQPADMRWGCEWYELNCNSVHLHSTLGPASFAYTPSMERAAVAAAAADTVSVVHQHSIWSGLSRVTNAWRTRTKRPTVVAAHGALAPFSLRQSFWKKRMALALYERKNLERASCLHALSEVEAKHYRDFGLKNPIAVIPNGVSGTCFSKAGDPDRFRRRFHLQAEQRIALYLSRITVQKGLPMLVEAAASMRGTLDDWSIVIAGVDHRGHQQEIESMVRNFGLTPRFKFIGPLFGEDKLDALAAADLYLLPSHSEGFPIAVLEAMAAGLPVLTTTGVPLPELNSGQYGWYVSPSIEGIASALTDALSRPSTELKRLGENARDFVRLKYAWPEISERTEKLYQWLLAKAPQPDFVIV